MRTCEICEEPTSEKIQAPCGHSVPICLDCQEECEEEINTDSCINCQETGGSSEGDKPVVQLLGSDSNAFSIIGKCMKVARREGWSNEKITQIREEMTSGDYNKVLVTAMKYFEIE